MIKILIIGIHDAMGGIEQIMYDYISRIKNKNLEFVFTNMHKKIVYQDEYEKMGYKVHALPNVKKNPVGYVRSLVKIIKQEKIDIVHYNMLSAANIIPLLIAKIVGCKWIIAHSHNTGTVGLHKYILHYFNRIFIPFFATELFTCSNEAGYFMFGKTKKTVLIRNAINIKNFSYCSHYRKEIREKLKITDGISIIGHVGRFAKPKNHSLLIKIFRCIVQKDEDIKLLLVGTGDMEPEIRYLVEKYELVDKVIFYGTSLEVYKLYSAMDIFVLPSLFEGLSIVGMEAQCSGLFVVASDTISKQMDISGLVKWHSLADSPERWADTIFEYLSKRMMTDMTETVTKAGYNIDVESKILERLYLDKR